MTVTSGGLQAFPAGPPGKSAYQLAVDNGSFVGTLAQWLASLQGAPGQTGAPGAPGSAGPAATVVAASVSSAAATVPSGATYVGVTAIASGGTTLTLPAAGTYQRGTSISIVDESGSCSSSLQITIAANGSDTISGQASFVLASAYQRLSLTSNGSNLWT